MTEFFATASFCDEVRLEANGKKIIIGEYSKDIVVPDLPYSLKSIHVTVRCGIPAEAQIQGMSIKLVAPDGTACEQKLPPPPPGKPIEPSERRLLAAHARFEDIALTQAGRLSCKVSFIGGPQDIHAGSLTIESPETLKEQGRGQIVLDDRDVDAVVWTTVQHLRLSHETEEERATYSEKLLRVLEPVARKLSNGIADNELIYIWPSSNICRVWYPHATDDANPEVVVTGAESYTISEQDRWGFTISFESQEDNTIELEVISPAFT